jgi:hypothetical protein
MQASSIKPDVPALKSVGWAEQSLREAQHIVLMRCWQGEPFCPTYELRTFFRKAASSCAFTLAHTLVNAVRLFI